MPVFVADEVPRDREGEREAAPGIRKVRRIQLVCGALGEIGVGVKRLDERVGGTATSDVAAFGFEDERVCLTYLACWNSIVETEWLLENVGLDQEPIAMVAVVVVTIDAELLGCLIVPALIVN